ncbi:MAG TPA: DUF2911 domain-containing protein [Vicinamibacteria bacterium]|nr:DUF2911 domain-containing protein [Vicinamibacteria bacterium]
MKKRIAIAGAALALAVSSFAQQGAQPTTAPRGEAKATVAGKPVSIDYGRPSLRGRDMLAQSQVGQAWRMGANAPTTLKTDADLAFGGARVPRGEYILTATKVDANGWTLNVLNQADRSKVADVPLTVEALPQSVEQFTIDLTGSGNDGDLKLSWGTTALRTRFTAR